MGTQENESFQPTELYLIDRDHKSILLSKNISSGSITTEASNPWPSALRILSSAQLEITIKPDNDGNLFQLLKIDDDQYGVPMTKTEIERELGYPIIIVGE